MKDYINVKLKKNNETEIGEKVEDINFVGIVGKKKAHIKPKGLDKLLNYLKLKAKSAFLIATINMIKPMLDTPYNLNMKVYNHD